MIKMKKIGSFFLAIILVLSFFQPVIANNASEIIVSVRVELMDSTIIPLSQVTLPASNNTFEDYGLKGQADPGFNTPVHALAQYFMDEWGTTTSEMSSLMEIQYANLSKIGGMYADESDSADASHFWMYMVNDKYPTPEESSYGYSMADCPLKNGDVVTLYAMKYPGTNYYAHFEKQQYTAEQGEAVNLTLLGKSTMGEDGSVPLFGAILISSNDGESPTIETNITTDSQGKASIHFNSPGTYTLSAKREDISRAYAQVTVTDSDSDSDVAVVASDKAALSVENEAYSNIILPTVGVSGMTRITWSSDDPSIKSDGKVTRGEVDKQVTLTATIEKASQKDTKNFLVTVKAFTEEEKIQSIASIKEAISSSTITAVEGKDTNLITMLQAQADNIVLGSKITLTDISKQPQVDINGNITYGSAASRNKEITYLISLLGKTDTGTVKVTIPAHMLTAQEAVDDDTAKLTWTKIKGSNVDKDNVLTNLSLPRTGDSYATDITWVSSNTSVISNTGTVTRSEFNQPDVDVELTATVSPGAYMEMYGYVGDAQSRTTTIHLTVKSYTQEDYDAGADDVAIVKEYIQKTNKVKDMDTGEIADLSNIDYDLQLISNNSTQTGVSNVDVEWSSTNPAITVNTLRGKITRPSIDSEGAKGKLIATISKAGYSDTLQLDTIVLPLTQAEIDDENAKIEKIANDLTFDIVKKENTNNNYITSNLQMVYRGYVENNGKSTYSTTNSGERGIAIQWSTSNSSVIASYGTVKRPTSANEKVIMTATLSSILLKGIEGVNNSTVEIPVTVIPPTPKLSNISLSVGNLIFDPDVTSYTVEVPSATEQITIGYSNMDTSATVKVTGAESDGKGEYIARLEDEVSITSTLGSESVEYTLKFVTTPIVEIPDIDKVREAITQTTKYIQDIGYVSDWIIVGLANAGETIPDDYLLNLSNEISNYFKDTVNTKGEKVTDHQRHTISVVAAGGNPINIGGQNLMDRIYNFYIEDYKRDITFQGLNGVIYGLIAVDTKDYQIPSDARYSREWMIDYLLEKQNLDGGWDLSASGTSDVDITAMALQALAPYHNRTKVEAGVNKGIEWLSKKQQEDGGYVNSGALSQTIIALCANGIDPTCKEFTKEGKNVIDALLSLQNANGSISQLKEDGGNNIATEQGYLALLAYDKFVKTGEKYDEGKTSVYSFLDEIVTGDREAADGVIKIIVDLPETITLVEKNQVEAARIAYTDLTSDQKALVTNISKLTVAEEKIALLEQEKAMAEVVVEQIATLPAMINLIDKDKVSEARSAYEKLTVSEKVLVTNLDKLTAAEAKIVQLEEDKKAANHVNEKINDLPEKITLADKLTVKMIRAAYTSLTSDQKVLVIHLNKLIEAEKTIQELEAKATPKDIEEEKTIENKDIKEENSSAKKDKKNNTSVNTGDTTPIVGILLLFSLALVGLLYNNKRKQV